MVEILDYRCHWLEIVPHLVAFDGGENCVRDLNPPHPAASLFLCVGKAVPDHDVTS